MYRLYCIATAVAAVGLVGSPASDVFAQGSAAGAAAAPAAAAPASPPPAAAPAAAPPPAATTTTAPADKPAADKTGDDKPAKKKKTAAKKGGQSELDRSIESGTVPSRYKSRIPKEYQGSIPWGR